MLSDCGERTRELFRPINHFYNLEGVNWFFNDLDKLDARRFVADNGRGEVLGFIYYYVKNGGGFLGIVVADEYQRMGIGNQLVEAVEEDARTRGLSSMSTGGGTLDGGPLQGLLSKRGYIDKGKYTATHCMMEKKLNGC
jgi:GNAT superfamily N-acetyltransferase